MWKEEKKRKEKKMVFYFTTPVRKQVNGMSSIEAKSEKHRLKHVPQSAKHQ